MCICVCSYVYVWVREKWLIRPNKKMSGVCLRESGRQAGRLQRQRPVPKIT